jgi:hypothetical protein
VLVMMAMAAIAASACQPRRAVGVVTLVSCPRSAGPPTAQRERGQRDGGGVREGCCG